MIQNSKHIRLKQTTGPSTRDGMSQKAVTMAIANTAISNTAIATVIYMKPGEYLSDIIQSITDATIDKQYTINFYNHSKTVNWDTFTQKIHVPRFIHINFVGNIDWWPNVYYPYIWFDEVTDYNPVDKLFLGFSFDRTEEEFSSIHLSGLPNILNKIFFGGLDSGWQMANGYADIENDPDNYGIGTLGLVRVDGSKVDDSRNDALYKKINDVFIDVTPEFMYCNFSGIEAKLAYFYSANCQSANFDFADCQSANFEFADCQSANFYSADCQSANFYSANCQSAYFYSANCQSANFDFANCQSANFYSANCQSANFYSANCQSANFYSANCQSANFRYADYQSANFRSANCQSAIFYSANCQSANFRSANCQSAYFEFADLRNADWSNVVSIVEAKFHNANLTGGINLPKRINTKAKWIAECGTENVNAETIWIDGTSILG